MSQPMSQLTLPTFSREETAQKHNRSQKHRDAQRRWRARNPLKKRDGHYRQRYGISLEQYEELRKVASGKCQCCGREETARDHRTGAVRNLSVDHNHATGEVRGLLCKRCNVAIGAHEADPALYENITRYLG